jgi:hypothetical protein
MNTISRRVISAVIAFVLYSVVSIVFVHAPPATLLASQVAANQLKNSDSSYLISVYSMHFLSGFGGIMTLVFLLALLVIWWGPVMRWLATLAVVALAVTGVHPQAASAYYDKQDYTEAYIILPNESAFWIPDSGANKDTQARFESEEYLSANKVPVKRFIIPHQKLPGSGAWLDYYVPAGRLIIVDRTPYNREWVDARDRGTSNRKEGFPCQTKEGLNVRVGASIGASVSEANAAKYLYRFGVLPPQGERTDPKVIFVSVYYSRKLVDVMDDVGRKKVQTLVCEEITSRSFDKVNEEAVKIMETVKQKATEYFASVGITLDFLGWADTFTFDEDVQNAVNRRYISSQDQAIAQALQPYIETVKALAAAQALRAFGNKTDGKLPTTIVGLPEDVGGLLGSLLSTSPGQRPHPAVLAPAR